MFTKADNAKIDFGSGTLNLDPKKRVYTAFVVYKKSLPPGFFDPTSKDSYTLDPKELVFGAGGCALGAKIGSVVGGIVGGTATVGILTVPVAALGGVAGCGIGFIAGDIISLASYSDYLYPSITLFESSSDQIKNACD